MEEKTTKEVTVLIPQGKRAEWKDVNGTTVLTLVDEEVDEKRPVTERIKTFEDAMNELGKDHPMVAEYLKVYFATYDTTSNNSTLSPDVLAYFKARIIVAALNEGWEPEFTTSEKRYAPYLELYTEKGMKELDDCDAESLVVFGYGENSKVYCAFLPLASYLGFSNSHTACSARLVFRNADIAKYASKQFADIWAAFMFKEVKPSKEKEKQ